MKKLFLLILFVTSQLVFALQSNPGSGKFFPSDTKSDQVFYHNEIEDLNWLGTDKWAVFYDFNEIFETIDSLSFEPTGCKIFLPQVTELLEVSLWMRGDFGNAILDSIAVATLLPAEQEIGWNELNFTMNSLVDTTWHKTSVWMMVRYPTYNGHEVAGSSGDGSHSYFFEDGVFRNMAGNGYYSELLFTLVGDFLFDFDVDYGIADFELVTVEVDDKNITVYPKFKLKNNSNSNLAELEFHYNSFAPPLAMWNNDKNITVEFDTPLTSGEERIIELASSIDTLLIDRSMYKFSLSIDSELDQLPQNNNLDFQLLDFSILNENHLVENFVRLDQYESTKIWQYQSVALDTISNQTINYFPIAQDDPFYQTEATGRFHYYNLGGVPCSILDGEERFIGYDETDSIIFDDTISSNSLKSFITSETVDGLYDLDNGSINFTFTLENIETHLFDDFLASININFVVVESYQDEEIFGDIFRTDLGSYRLDQLQREQTQDIEVSFNLFSEVNTISGDDDFSNCKIIYWVQNIDTNQQFLIGTIDFNLFPDVSADENQITDLVDINFTNPSFSDSNLKISISNSRSISNPEISIYNIKGQKINSISNYTAKNDQIVFDWNGKDKNDHTVASGLYFMKLSNQASQPVYRKFVRIKK